MLSVLLCSRPTYTYIMMRLTIVYLMNGRSVQQMMSHFGAGKYAPPRHNCRRIHIYGHHRENGRFAHLELNKGNSSCLHDVAQRSHVVSVTNRVGKR